MNCLARSGLKQRAILSTNRSASQRSTRPTVIAVAHSQRRVINKYFLSKAALWRIFTIYGSGHGHHSSTVLLSRCITAFDRHSKAQYEQLGGTSALKRSGRSALSACCHWRPFTSGRCCRHFEQFTQRQKTELSLFCCMKIFACSIEPIDSSLYNMSLVRPYKFMSLVDIDAQAVCERAETSKSVNPAEQDGEAESGNEERHVESSEERQETRRET